MDIGKPRIVVQPKRVTREKPIEVPNWPKPEAIPAPAIFTPKPAQVPQEVTR